MFDEKKVLDEAVARFGGLQLMKACEELAELQQAILKLFDETVHYESYEEHVDMIVEEMADVEIMLDQVRVLLEVDPQREARWRRRKLRRLKARMETR